MSIMTEYVRVYEMIIDSLRTISELKHRMCSMAFVFLSALKI